MVDLLVGPDEAREALVVETASATARFNDALAALLRMRRDDPRVVARIEEIAQQIDADPVTITFGGHFSAGKSSMINAALRRTILPTDDLPETGAICLLRSGDSDAAEVYLPNARRALACTTSAIRDEVSVYSASGERRSDLREIAWLNVTLTDVSIPPRARWIDSPGINDTESMDFRAWQAACYSDVLFWVVSSRQPLSESEVAFVSRHVGKNGPASVVFLVNAFLSQDTPEAWSAFCERNLPVFVKKIQHWAPTMGLGDSVAIVTVSARAVAAQGGDEFGGRELRQLIESIDAPTHLRARSARLDGAAQSLRDLLNRPTADSKAARWAEAEAIVARLGLPGGRAPGRGRPTHLPGQPRPSGDRPVTLPP